MNKYRCVTGRAKRIVPKPSPITYSRPAPSNSLASTTDEQNQSVIPTSGPFYKK
jgi:hypothetical protein